MSPASMPLFARWRYALKPASWPKLLVAAALGQAIGIAATGSVDPLALSLGVALVVFDLAFVVLLNDWGDQEVDALKRRIAADLCSPKTIPDGILESSSVLWGGLGAGALMLAVAATAEYFMPRPGLTLAALACLLLFVAYTLPPLRLNYRGGGEVLEMLGVGFALPWMLAYLQSGVAVPRGLVVLPAFALMCLASALASGLSDEPSDRLGGKRTFTTMFGAASVRHAAEGLILGAILVWAALPLLASDVVQIWMVAPVVLVMSVDYQALRKQAARSEPEDELTHAGYKARLHDCVWRGALVLAVVLIVTGILRGGIGA
ncbi:MAG: prenyltransferase [Nannocystaceae bacterium]|nr:prenyltransferase [Nannocystaceae bacterium]